MHRRTGRPAGRPAWFHRVYKLAMERERRKGWSYCDDDLQIYPEDYDKDLSDCSSMVSCSSELGCTFDEYDECTKHADHDGGQSDSSTGSNGSGMGCIYNQMEFERKQRKRELRDQIKRRLDQKKRKAEEREEALKDVRLSRGYQDMDELEFETRQVNEIKGLLAKAIRERESTPLEHLGDRVFKLWSIDHVKHLPGQINPQRYIKFSSNDEWDGDNERYSETKNQKMGGKVVMVTFSPLDRGVIQSASNWWLSRFRPPTNSTTETHQLSTCGGEWKFDVRFFDNNHLTIKISRDLVFSKTLRWAPANAPRVFTYYGVCENYLMQKEKRRRQEKRARLESS